MGGAFGEFQILCAPFSARLAAGFHSYCSCKAVGLQGCCKTGVNGIILGKVNATEFVVLSEIQPFFLNKMLFGLL